MNGLPYDDCICGERDPKVILIEDSNVIVAQVCCMRCRKRITVRIYGHNRDGTLSPTPNTPQQSWTAAMLAERAKAGAG